MLKSLDEIDRAIDLMFQEKDVSQQTKSKNLLKLQFCMALDKIAGLERTNKRLKDELEQYPEYQKQQLLNAVSPYLKLLNK